MPICALRSGNDVNWERSPLELVLEHWGDGTKEHGHGITSPSVTVNPWIMVLCKDKHRHWHLVLWGAVVVVTLSSLCTWKGKRRQLPLEALRSSWTIGRDTLTGEYWTSCLYGRWELKWLFVTIKYVILLVLVFFWSISFCACDQWHQFLFSNA